jgi:hypothetical protein
LSGAWPKSGMMRNGTLYRLSPSVPHTFVRGSSLWRTFLRWPTPTADNRQDHMHLDTLLKSVIGGHQVQLTTKVRLIEMGLWKKAMEQRREFFTMSDSHTPRKGRRRRPAVWGEDPENWEDSCQEFLEREVPPLLRTSGGALNPAWVEWLMGFPQGWTDLGASGTPSSPRSQNGSENASRQTRFEGGT